METIKVTHIDGIHLIDMHPEILNESQKNYILRNLGETSGRLLQEETKDEEIAVVCYGPSLKQTWERLKDYKKILTCSGAHNFLIERGIIPTYHMDCDPRKSKITFTRKPHPDVEYLMASSCPGRAIKNLKKNKLRLWNLDFGKQLQYPEGELVQDSPGCIGLSALDLAAGMLAYRKVDVFGMDCSYTPDTKWAGRHHPNHEEIKYVMCNDQIFKSTRQLVIYAKQFFNVIKKFPDTQITVIGSGLLPEMIYCEAMKDVK